MVKMKCPHCGETHVWRDEEANRVHRRSDAVKKFAGILDPNCIAPVEFMEYRQVDASASLRRV